MEKKRMDNKKILHIVVFVVVLTLTSWNIYGIIRNKSEIDVVISRYNEVIKVNNDINNVNENLRNKLSLYENDTEKSQKNNTELLYDIDEYKDKIEELQTKLDLTNDMIKKLTDKAMKLETQLYDSKSGQYVIVDDNLDTDIVELVLSHFRALSESKKDLFLNTLSEETDIKGDINSYFDDNKGVYQKITRISYNGEGMPPSEGEFYLLVFMENGSENVRVPGVVKEDDEWRIFDYDFK